MRRTDDEGSILLLTIGLTAVALLLVAVVVDVSVVVLAQRSLASTADGAALVAAQQPDRARIAQDGFGDALPLDAAAAQRVVAEYGRDQPQVQLTVTVTGSEQAVVQASRTVRLPFTGWLGVSSWQVRAVGRARSPVVRAG